jgi:hypothetical protein
MTHSQGAPDYFLNIAVSIHPGLGSGGDQSAGMLPTFTGAPPRSEKE